MMHIALFVPHGHVFHQVCGSGSIHAHLGGQAHDLPKGGLVGAGQSSAAIFSLEAAENGEKKTFSELIVFGGIPFVVPWGEVPVPR